MAKKDDVKDRGLELAALEEDIARRQSEVEERERDLQEEEEKVETKKSALDDREIMLKDHLDQIEVREKALDEKVGEIQPVLSPAPARKRLRFKCIKKCHHVVSPKRPATRRVYIPGDDFFAFEGDEVPHHFKLIRDEMDELEAGKKIDEENQKYLPPFLASKEAMTHGA